jgi:tRNA-2-methylthio-N6-dimethylallyladenosine synthase
MNKADSERIAGDYQARGYTQASSLQDADEIVLTTCSVRKSAEDRVLGTVHNLMMSWKTSKKRPKLILTGCMLHYPEEQLRKMMPTVDEFLPITEVGFNNPSVRQDKQHAWIPISHGCNSFCTFCIVPRSRGRETSRPKQDILREIEMLIQRGYTSVTLLGQNVNSWGLEKVGMSLRKRLDQNRQIPAPQTQYLPFEGTPPFVDLLETICQYPELKSIQFITSNPWDFHEELIETIATYPQIDRLIHLPVQAGSNEVLKRMNRGYTREQFLTLIQKIRALIPNARFGTDIIVGFPGETREQFEETVDLCKQVDFEVAYVARYSPRQGTVSAKLYPDDVSDQEKKYRWKVLEELVNSKYVKQ